MKIYTYDEKACEKLSGALIRKGFPNTTTITPDSQWVQLAYEPKNNENFNAILLRYKDSISLIVV